MNRPLVSLRGVGVDYDGCEALRGVDLDIYPDDFLGIVGPNGGGKTTLVRAILGMVPYSGRIEFAPELFRGHERLIGYMPQLAGFDRSFPISVEETVLSGLQGGKGLFGRYTRTDRRRVRALLDAAGIGDLARRSVGKVSGGQLQRALLCRAVVSEPRLLLLDEPTNFVDHRFENELYASLRELSGQMAIAMVSHDIGTISGVVRTIVCVNRTLHRHDSNRITEEQLRAYDCPIRL